jgi:hypothetical protein
MYAVHVLYLRICRGYKAGLGFKASGGEVSM